MSDRDAWCTPRWMTELLPDVDLDPCSNERSTVRSRRRYMLPEQDGLALPWSGSVFVNGPFSGLMPWAMKLASERVHAAAFLVNVDTSTTWWNVLSALLRNGLFFHKRIQFVPPPGVKPSTNNKPQVLLMDDAFLALCSADLLATGTLWSVAQRKQAAVIAGVEV